MTTDPTPLTQESRDLIDSASYTEGPGKDTLREALYRIEAAAARRAIEGSGVCPFDCDACRAPADEDLLREVYGQEKADIEHEAGLTADRVYVVNLTPEAR